MSLSKPWQVTLPARLVFAGGDEVSEAVEGSGLIAPGRKLLLGLGNQVVGTLLRRFHAEELGIRRLIDKQVLARGLAERGRVRRHVQDVINDLERQADVDGKLGQPLYLLGVCAAEDAAADHAELEQRGRLVLVNPL